VKKNSRRVFQTAEYLLRARLVDQIVPRTQLKSTLVQPFFFLYSLVLHGAAPPVQQSMRPPRSRWRTNLPGAKVLLSKVPFDKVLVSLVLVLGLGLPLGLAWEPAPCRA